MENLSIVLDPEHNGRDFDAALENTLPEAGDMKVIVKHGATKSDNSAVMVTFTVQLPDGTMQRVQSVTTAKLFIQAGNAVKGSVDRLENISIVLDPEHNGRDFDAALENTLPEAGDMKVIVKHGATKSDNSAVMVTFTVQLPDGTMQRVQSVTTAKLFIQAGNAVKGSVDRYQALKGMI